MDWDIAGASPTTSWTVKSPLHCQIFQASLSCKFLSQFCFPTPASCWSFLKYVVLLYSISMWDFFGLSLPYSPTEIYQPMNYRAIFPLPLETWRIFSTCNFIWKHSIGALCSWPVFPPRNLSSNHLVGSIPSTLANAGPGQLSYLWDYSWANWTWSCLLTITLLPPQLKSFVNNSTGICQIMALREAYLPLFHRLWDCVSCEWNRLNLSTQMLDIAWL